MTTAFVSRNIWPEITKAVRASRQRCVVAVAYFGAGASHRLPLPKGSSLVVDASERAVMSGQTCPEDLKKMLSRGVTVYSVPNLHAKVFVVGKTAYIGSTNVSQTSASRLIEAVVRTTEPKVLREARKFVENHCLDELTPKLLERLVKLYRPPKIPRGKGILDKVIDSSRRPTLPPLFLVQLENVTLSEHEVSLRDRGTVIARKRCQHPRKWRLDNFLWSGSCPFKWHDKVIQVADEGGGRVLVDPPGNVLYVRSGKVADNRRKTFVYIEVPNRRRKQLPLLARTLGCTQKQLRRQGQVRNAELKRSLLSQKASK